MLANGSKSKIFQRVPIPVTETSYRTTGKNKEISSVVNMYIKTSTSGFCQHCNGRKVQQRKDEIHQGEEKLKAIKLIQ